MNFLIIVLIVLAVSKVTFQGSYARKYISDVTDSICFNGIIYFFASIIFAYTLKCSPPVIAYAFMFGLFTVIFQLCYIQAMRCGNISITVLIVNSGMIIPIFVSALFFDEKFGMLKLLGILAIFVALGLNTQKNVIKFNLKWILYAITSFLMTGCLSVCQQLFGKSAWHNERAAFVAWSYLLATIISFALYIILKPKYKKNSGGIKAAAVRYGLCTGVFLGAFQFLNTKAIATLDAGLLFPVYNGGTLILTTVMGVLLFKDKLTKNQIASIIVGIIGIIIINL